MDHRNTWDMAGGAEPGNAWVGKPIVLDPGITVGSLIRLEEHAGKLVGIAVEPWESLLQNALIFRVEAGLAPGQIRIRRVRRAQ